MALEIESFVGPCEIARAYRPRLFPFGKLSKLKSAEQRLYNGAKEASLLWAHSLPYPTGLPYWSAMLNMVKS